MNNLGGLTLDFQTLAVAIGVLGVVYYILFSQFGKRLGTILHDVMFSNWRLALLGVSGIVLSVASGWTTWSGMSNFTNHPILSALVTFGIQGIMLIVAWLIGESFATGMNHRPSKHVHGQSIPALRALQPLASSIAGILLFSAIGIIIYTTFAEPSAVKIARSGAAPFWTEWWDKLAIAAPVIVLVTLLIVNAGSDVLSDYTQSLRVMIRGAVLWVMFLACMATSVFFSFDSLFSSIFPANERQRAAELRAQNQVAGIVNDIGSLAATRRLTEQEDLFKNQAWLQYDQMLNNISKVAASAEDKLRAFMEDKLRKRQAEINRFREDKSSAESQQISLTQRKAQLNVDIGRLREQVTSLAPEVARLKAQLFAKDRELIAKNAEAEAEAGGIGVTSKAGRGPKYRELKQQLFRLTEEKRNLQLQLREFEKRLTEARKKLAQSETELAQTDAEIAKLKGRSDTADRLISARAKRVDSTPTFDASNGLLQLTRAREEFRREPTAARLGKIQSLCGAIVGAIESQDALRQQARGLSCDPGVASEAAARVFALNAGIISLQAKCIGGSRLPSTGGADALFSFARRCVQDSGLPSQDTEILRQKINFIELNRDDKAHRFVVTINAFQDGNRLAYLALAIAIAIDSLVFMSGLFGANAVRSPLSDVPSFKGRSARQLEDVIENALLPDKFENAMFALDAIQPLHGSAPASLGPGWTHESIVPESEFATRLRVLKVMNAGATIGAVRRDESNSERYFIRSELLEFLNQVAKKAFEKDKDKVKLSELRKILTVALQPYVSDHADIVLGHMHPISDKTGYTSEIYMSEMPIDDVPIVQRALNAGSTLDYVHRDGRKDESDRFYIHKDFYRTLAMMSAENQKFGRRLTFGHHRLTPPEAANAAIEGGALTANAGGALDNPNAGPARQITDETVPLAPARPVAAAAPAATEGSAEFVGHRHQSESEIRRELLEHLIQALNIDPESYFELSGPAFGPALAASETFKQQRLNSDLLERNLRQRDRQAEQRIDAAHEAIEAKIVGDDAAFHKRMLDDARNEIEQNWAILMILPNGPYEILFRQMIENYEKSAADGLLSADEEALLDNVRAIRSAIVNNPRRDQGDWVQLKQDLDRVTDQDDGDGQAAVVPINRHRA